MLDSMTIWVGCVISKYHPTLDEKHLSHPSQAFNFPLQGILYCNASSLHAGTCVIYTYFLNITIIEFCIQHRFVFNPKTLWLFKGFTDIFNTEVWSYHRNTVSKEDQPGLDWSFSKCSGNIVSVVRTQHWSDISNITTFQKYSARPTTASALSIMAQKSNIKLIFNQH